MAYRTHFQKAKLIVDEAFSNGFNWTRAYMSIMNVDKPEMAKRAVHAMKERQEVKDYITFKESEIQIKYDINKDKIVRELIDLVNECKKDTVGDKKNLIKGLDMLNKMFGYYSPEKHEHNLSGVVVNIIKPNKDNNNNGD